MKFKFQSFVDISTSATSMQVIQWNVGGPDVLLRCRHLFGAYKYFKLGKIDIKMVPASTLPVDPLGLSYSSSDPQTVDPRDQMNPGLVRITNGEDIFTNVSSLSATAQEKIYNTMMLDPRWSKFMLQSGFRRSAYPLYWQVGQLSQDCYPGATTNLPPVVTTSTTGLSTGMDKERFTSDYKVVDQVWTGHSSARGLFQVGHRGKLGWLPTDYYQQFFDSNGNATDNYGLNMPPEVSVITCVLPKAYKTVYYYRVFITETVYFAGLRSSPLTAENEVAYSGLDQFVLGQPTVVKPGNTLGMPGGMTMYGNSGRNLP